MQARVEVHYTHCLGFWIPVLRASGSAPTREEAAHEARASIAFSLEDRAPAAPDDEVELVMVEIAAARPVASSA